MDGISSAYNDRGFLHSSKCKLSVFLMLVIVMVEIYTVQQWENKSAIVTAVYQRDNNLQYIDFQTNEDEKSPENVPDEIQPVLKDQEKKNEQAVMSIEKQPESGNLVVTNHPVLEDNKNGDTTTEADEIKKEPHDNSKIVEKHPTVEDQQMKGIEDGGDLEKKPKHRSYAVQKYLELEDQLKKHLEKATDKKIIVTWVPMFGDKPQITLDQTNCGNCDVTYDRNKVSDDKTGAVVFHFDRINKNDMPKPRNLKHLYIYWALESAATLRVVRGHSLQFENEFQFNDTMTYRRDSGFYNSYDDADIVEIVKARAHTPEDLLQEKNKLAVIVVSNCGGTPGARIRMNKLKEIQNLGFSLDGFGGCFPGGRRFANGKSRGSQEFHDAVRKYKFYFSFENSFHCKDYITEKFFNNAIASFAVPVVWGAKKEDYEAVAPPGSFIYADDFSSMKELTDYLKYLDSNDTAYMQYLRWVTMEPEEMPQYGRATFYCQICRAIHGINIDDIYSPKFDDSKLLRPLFSDGVAPRRLNGLINWIYGKDNQECFNR